jgi:hypothetical protein
LGLPPFLASVFHAKQAQTKMNGDIFLTSFLLFSFRFQENLVAFYSYFLWFSFQCWGWNPGPCSYKTRAVLLSSTPVQKICDSPCNFLLLTLVFVLVVVLVFGGGAQGLKLARQVLYHFRHSSSPVLCWVFSR